MNYLPIRSTRGENEKIRKRAFSQVHVCVVTLFPPIELLPSSHNRFLFCILEGNSLSFLHGLGLPASKDS